jgi:hypothetical protein
MQIQVYFNPENIFMRSDVCTYDLISTKSISNKDPKWGPILKYRT